MCRHNFVYVDSFSEGANRELVCANCGIVNNSYDDICIIENVVPEGMFNADGLKYGRGPLIPFGLELLLLPTSIQNNIRYYKDNFDKKILQAFKVYNRLSDYVAKSHIPKNVLYMTLRIMIKSNKYFYSERKQIQLLNECCKQYMGRNARLIQQEPKIVTERDSLHESIYVNGELTSFRVFYNE